MKGLALLAASAAFLPGLAGIPLVIDVPLPKTGQDALKALTAARGDYAPRPDSEVFRRIPGFRPIPFERIGLLTKRKCPLANGRLHPAYHPVGSCVPRDRRPRTPAFPESPLTARTKICSPAASIESPPAFD